MSVHSTRDDPTRVLGIVVHPRYTGIAVLDRWGLVGRGFWIVDSRRHRGSQTCSDILAAHVAAIVRRFRPAQVVVSREISIGEQAPALLECVVRALERAGGAVAVRSLGGSVTVFVGRGSRSVADLPRVLTHGIFPELTRFVVTRRKGTVFSRTDAERYRRHAWQALALAIHELALRHPHEAFALLRQRVGTLPEIIARAERRRHPHS